MIHLLYRLAKPFLFRLPPERAHFLTVRGLRRALELPYAGKVFEKLFTVPAAQAVALERTVFGIHFPNPVGLAAGFDKDGRYYNDMAALGFGFVEIGTVTPRPQNGNPAPRLFRLPADGAHLNRMGFNNDGATAMRDRLLATPPRVVVGGNIGKNKDTPNEHAAADYLFCFETLYPVVDYFVVNVSSPNTPDLRALQARAPLTALLTALQAANAAKPKPKPLLLKIAPDLTNTELDDILDIVRQTGIAGIIATNTTTSREGLRTSAHVVAEYGAGGISGAPLRARSLEVVRYLAARSGVPVVAVGGIATAADAQAMLEAGAALVQVYTGLVYEGPSLVRRICAGISGK